MTGDSYRVGMIVFVEHPDLPEHWRHRARARP
jgi:hypothetical protein